MKRHGGTAAISSSADGTEVRLRLPAGRRGQRERESREQHRHSGTRTQGRAQAIRVVIVDDHAIFRSGLKADLDASIVVVGEAGTVEQAIAVIAQTRPEVVLLDVHLPGGLGGGGREVIAGSAALLSAPGSWP